MRFLLLIFACLASARGICRTAEQIAQTMVMKIDTNKDGMLSEAEFDHEISNNHDLNRDGCTQQHEFVHQWMKEYHVNYNVGEKFFVYLDTDGNKCLTFSDLHQDYTLMDADGDDQVFSGEFIAWFLKAHLDNNPGHHHQHCIGH